MAALWIDLVVRIDDPAVGRGGPRRRGSRGASWPRDCSRRAALQCGSAARVPQALGLLAIALLAGLFIRALRGPEGDGRRPAKEADEFDGLDLAEHDIGAYPDFQQDRSGATSHAGSGAGHRRPVSRRRAVELNRIRTDQREKTATTASAIATEPAVHETSPASRRSASDRPRRPRAPAGREPLGAGSRGLVREGIGVRGIIAYGPPGAGAARHRRGTSLPGIMLVVAGARDASARPATTRRPGARPPRPA